MDKVIIKESVRNLVEFCLKKGDIDNRFSGSSRAVDGIRVHQKLQADNETIYDNYEKEVYLRYNFETDKSVIEVEGRADGIIVKEEKIIIEEIKSTYRKFSYIDDTNELHWAQAKMYAFIYAKKINVKEVYIRLSYVQLESSEVKSFENKFEIKELEKFALKLIKEYENFNIYIYEKTKERNASIKKVEFPFNEYRQGQKKLAQITYNTIKNKEILFAQAPTGIGKTISTIFPALKAIGEGYGDKIIYLTSKTINREVAEDAFRRLRENGLNFKTIIITAKEKICCNDKFDCNPERCIYAKNYYEKVRNAIVYILKNENSISKEMLNKYAEKYNVCPFELSLDLSMYCDGIICDYNYMFNPNVSLTRLIENSSNIVLIDEAHNLIDRARNMYSATLYKSQILNCKKITKGKINKLNSILGKINSYFIELRNECDSKEIEFFYEEESPNDLIKYLKLYLKESEEILIKANKFEGYDEILQLYFDINKFIAIMKLYDKNYMTYMEKESKEFKLTLFCVNPSKNLQEYLSKCYSIIFFSATLSPIKYYINMLGGTDESYRLKLSSPFNKENLKVFISPINIRYNHRKRTLGLVIKKICSFINEQVGNYMIFSPSYTYMELLWDEITKYNIEKFKLIKQEQNMSEKEKEIFLNNFIIKKNILAFCVLGGMFSEGIDLPGEELIGSIVIGVGYPKISIENNIIKEFYKEKGYDYAYIFPGMNKVEQSVGRVIRSEHDRGRVLLIDDRYITDKYKLLLPNEWYPIKKY